MALQAISLYPPVQGSSILPLRCRCTQSALRSCWKINGMPAISLGFLPLHLFGCMLSLEKRIEPESRSFSSIMGTASHVHDGQVRYLEVMPQYPPNDGSLGWGPSLPGLFVWALSDSFCETGCVQGTCCYSITYMAIIAIPPRMRRGMRSGLPHICALSNRCAVVLTEGGRGQTDRRMSAIVSGMCTNLETWSRTRATVKFDTAPHCSTRSTLGVPSHTALTTGLWLSHPLSRSSSCRALEVLLGFDPEVHWQSELYCRTQLSFAIPWRGTPR